MRNKGYLFLVLIFLVCILSVSAVSAAEDLASDINTDDSQELILEENIEETVSTSADDNQELTAVSDNVDDSTGNTKLETSTKVSEKSKVAAEKVARLSVACSLKRASSRNFWACSLGARWQHACCSLKRGLHA